MRRWRFVLLLAGDDAGVDGEDLCVLRFLAAAAALLAALLWSMRISSSRDDVEDEVEFRDKLRP